MPSHREWPAWSLPPPERNVESEDMAANYNQRFDSESCNAVAIASVEESDYSSAQNRMMNKLVSNNQLSPPESSYEAFNQRNETSQIDNSQQICLTASDTSQSDTGIPPRPPTPEEGSHSRLLTGCQSHGTSVAVITCGGSSKPAEHDDVIRNDGLLQDFKQVTEDI